jgi:GNAT superfamily N-acetyltransferase
MGKDCHWVVRDGNEKDLTGILSLRKLAFGETEGDKLSPEAWHWEYEENPDGKGWISIVEDRGKIIGHHAIIPRRFSVRGEIVLGTHQQDLMVDPDKQRKGIFHAMSKYEKQKVKEKKVLFMTAFPFGVPTYSGLKKIGWKDVAKLPVLVNPIRFSGILNRYLHFPPLSLLLGGMMRFFYFFLYGFRKPKSQPDIEIEKIDSIDESFDHFWQKASFLYPIMGVRDREYLTWRYFRHPTRTYTLYRARKGGEMRGYIVLRKIDLLNFNSAVIVDLLTLDQEALSALVERAIRYCRGERVDLLGFMVPQTHDYHKALKKMGFLPSFKTFRFIVYFHSDEKMLLFPENWYVNWGDTDHL